MSTTQGQQEVVVKGSIKCQECGNQAKKDCAYSRCRTCCKNKGFECQTHIRSTWIPVDRRRQRMEQHPSPTSTNPNHLQGAGDVSKRHKQNPYSGLEELRFPAATSSMAVFSCVRVRSMDDTVNEIAYQTSVNIGGHVFSGLLYDQGPEQSFNNAARGESSTHSFLDHHHQQNLNLVGANSIRDGATASMAPLSVNTAYHQPLSPPPHHPFSLASLRPGGMPYFSHPKP